MPETSAQASSGRFHCEIRGFKEALHAPVAHLFGITAVGGGGKALVGKNVIIFCGAACLAERAWARKQLYFVAVAHLDDRSHLQRNVVSLAQHQTVTCVRVPPTITLRSRLSLGIALNLVWV